jgi:hypothetical protein
MHSEFQVWKDAQLIYSMSFPTGGSWQFDEFSKVALADFHAQQPAISLTDEDVSMNWTCPKSSWVRQV